MRSGFGRTHALTRASYTDFNSVVPSASWKIIRKFERFGGEHLDPEGKPVNFGKFKDYMEGMLVQRSEVLCCEPWTNGGLEAGSFMQFPVPDVPLVWFGHNV